MPELKRIIRDASALHERSWNGTRYNYSVVGAIRQITTDMDQGWVAYQLLTLCWNDALDWAGKE